MRLKMLIAVLVGVGALAAAGVAAAGTMHPELAARLSGMGEHGVVNLQSHEAEGRLCWTFDVMTAGITGATIRDTHGMIVAKLGSGYSAKGCATVSKKALDLIESKPHLGISRRFNLAESNGVHIAGQAGDRSVDRTECT